MSQRQAASAALHRLGLTPESSRTINYVAIDKAYPWTSGLNGFFAYEWWRPVHDSNPSSMLGQPCLVLYYGRGMLDSPRGKAIGRFRELLREQVLQRVERPRPVTPSSGPGGGSDLSPKNIVLMRITSTSLFDDVREWERSEGWKEGAEGGNLVCINSSATADARVLFKGELGDQQSKAGQWAAEDEGKQRTWNGPVRRVLGSDRALLGLLVKELKLRGVSFDDGDNVIAVVHERDSEFGRALLSTFEDIARNAGKTADTLVPISYLAAVDGDTLSVPRTELPARIMDSGKDGSNVGLDASIASSGQAQLDYIYRALREKAETLQVTRAGKLRAVFVCASDRWDVRPIIQMIRRHFPSVMILVTDLYGQYADPVDYSTMRNIIVASHLGLSLHPDIQGAIPPFRSSYQTSMFLGILQGFYACEPNAVFRQFAVLGDAPNARLRNGDIGAVLAGARPSGRTFEISRDGAVKLPDILAPIDEPPLDHEFYSANVRPGLLAFAISPNGRGIVVTGMVGGIMLVVSAWLIKRSKRRGWRRYVLSYVIAATTCLLILGLGIFWGVSKDANRLLLFFGITFTGCVVVHFLAWTWRYKEGAEPGPAASGESGWEWCSVHTEGACLIGVMWAAVAGCVMVIAWGSAEAGEPFSWGNGISIWPAELLRLAAILLGCVFLWRYVNVYSREPRDVHSAQPVTALAPGESRWAAWCASVINGFHVLAWHPPQGGDHAVDSVDSTKLRAQLYDRLKPASAALRIAVVALPFAGLASAVYVLEGPDVYAVRGVFAQNVNSFLEIALACILNAVVFVAWDSARVHNRYIRNLSSATWSVWSPSRLKEEARATGMDERLVAPLIDVREIARTTAAVNGRIYWPVAMILLGMLALHPRFDVWPQSWAAVTAFGLSLLIAVYAGFMLRKAAEHARDREIERLERWVLDPKACLDEYERLSKDWNASDAQSTSSIAELEAKGGETIPSRTKEELISEGLESVIAWAHLQTQSSVGAPVARPMARGAVLAAVAGASAGVIIDARQQDRAAKESAHAVSAEEARASQQQEERKQGAQLQLEKVLSTQASVLIQRIRGLREGAFALWTDDPIVRATVLPLAGFLSVQAVNWMNGLFGQ